MNNSDLREKIIDQFNDIIEDSSKLTVLEGIFDSLTSNKGNSQVPEEQYQLIQERRERYHSSKAAGAGWEEVKQRLVKKHDL